MKLHGFLISLLLVSSSVFAQNDSRQLAINQTVAEGVFSEQKAITTIIATNEVRPGASAHYMAGKSVTLQPGFITHAGSVFLAAVEPVSASGAVSDRPGLSARAYPNPFVDQVTVDYTLPLGGSVRHTLLDAKCQILQQYKEVTEQSAGSYQTQIDGRTLPEGIYLYKLQVGSESRTLRLVKKP